VARASAHNRKLEDPDTETVENYEHIDKRDFAIIIISLNSHRELPNSYSSCSKEHRSIVNFLLPYLVTW